jgi:uncharacterized membrane protein (UPF0127 family)
MKILNTANQAVLATQAEVADTPWKRMKGLLGRKNFSAGQALILKPCNSVHTFFMTFAIDALFIDRENRVLAAPANLRPFRLTRIYPRAKLVVELPAGVVQTTQTLPGQMLSFVD